MTEDYLTIPEVARLKIKTKTVKNKIATHRLYNPVCHSKDLKIRVYYLAVPELCPFEDRNGLT